MAGITAPAFQQSVPPAAGATLRASRFLLGHAEAASKLPIAGEDNAAEGGGMADAFTRCLLQTVNRYRNSSRTG